MRMTQEMNYRKGNTDSGKDSEEGYRPGTPPHTHATPLHSLYPFVPLGPGIAKPHSALGTDDVQMNDGHITCPQVTALQLGRVARHSLNSLFP